MQPEDDRNKPDSGLSQKATDLIADIRSLDPERYFGACSACRAPDLDLSKQENEAVVKAFKYAFTKLVSERAVSEGVTTLFRLNPLPISSDLIRMYDQYLAKEASKEFPWITTENPAIELIDDILGACNRTLSCIQEKEQDYPQLVEEILNRYIIFFRIKGLLEYEELVADRIEEATVFIDIYHVTKMDFLPTALEQLDKIIHASFRTLYGATKTKWGSKYTGLFCDDDELFE